MSRYRVFVRDWWKENPTWPNGLEPCAGVKIPFGTVATEAAARQMCKAFAHSNPPGRYSRKAEYEEL